MQFLVGLVDRHPDMYLDEIVEQLAAQRNITVSLATVHRALELLGFTSKKVRFIS